MIRIVGPVLLTTGYSQMARDLCFGLVEAEMNDITITSVTFGKGPDQNLKEEAESLERFIDRPGKPDTVIQCLTPDNFQNYIVPGAKNIGYTMWETNKLPGHWPALCNRMDLILVPSTFCKNVFKMSGVTTRIEILPIGTNTSKFKFIESNTELRDAAGPDNMLFYSIFEWSERKNPSALLNAYYSTFGHDDKVTLVIKSYGSPKPLQKMVESYRGGITRHNTDYPKVVCISEFLTTEQILQVHKTCDVYLGPVRGEGWSIPMFDAALACNHIITTSFSSQRDFLDTYVTHKYQVYDLCHYQLEPVHSMHNLYTADQMWASIDMREFTLKMRRVYDSWKKSGSVPGLEVRQRYKSEYLIDYDRKTLAERLLKLL